MKVNKDIEKEISSRVGDKRYEHILRVVKMARKLAEIHNIDKNKAELAAYYHDCAKTKKMDSLLSLSEEVDFHVSDEMKEFPQIIHAHLGAKVANVKYGIEDEDVLNAITYHTTAREGMSDLEKLIYLADYIEEGRKFPSVEECREEAYKDLNMGMNFALKNTINFLIKNNMKIALDTIKCWNERN